MGNKGNGSQQMGRYGCILLREGIVFWRNPDDRYVLISNNRNSIEKVVDMTISKKCFGIRTRTPY
jgi:hypothetical protein